ncbi:SRPBCC family protein [Daejeonella sp.]|uniref:SRPBCC family protein n=1 Tax=Daejeonella sp. TaxID=2805397 RepID=UPI003983C7D5
MIYTFNSEHFLKTDIATAWDFFSSAKNLARITPPEMAFKIHTQLENMEVYEGMIIDYTVSPLLGIALKWQTEICQVDKPNLFTDRQLKGPYSLWEHTHRFTEKDNGVLMQDEVKYKLPLGIIGDLAHNLLVREKIKKIFDFREEALNKLFK